MFSSYCLLAVVGLEVVGFWVCLFGFVAGFLSRSARESFSECEPSCEGPELLQCPPFPHVSQSVSVGDVPEGSLKRFACREVFFRSLPVA